VLVAERVGEALDRMPRCDCVSVQVQLAVELDERHRPVIAGENREGDGPQILALKRTRRSRRRRDGRRAAPVRETKAVDDVLRIDGGPHDDAHLGQLGADHTELPGEVTLLGVELGGLLEQRRALGVEGCELARPVRDASVAGRIANGGHGDFPAVS